MKKLLARPSSKLLLLALVLIPIALVATGCGGGSKKKKSPPPPPPQTQCYLTVTWTNPTMDVNGNQLGPTALTAATVYFFRIPEEPRDTEMQHVADAYTLRFTFIGAAENVGIKYYLSLTVTNDYGESDQSNQVERTCE